MKPKELNSLIESLVYDEIRSKIVSEMLEGKKSVYHIMSDGEPIETFDSLEDAKEHVDKLKKDHPGKQFIIEKAKYESDSDMIDKLDEMGEKLEEKENIDMKKNPKKFKSLAEAIFHAKESNIKKIKLLNEIYDVDETWKSMEEEETCDECGQMEEIDISEDDLDKPISDYDLGDEGDEDTFELPSKLKGIDLGKSFNKMKGFDDTKYKDLESEKPNRLKNDLSEEPVMCNECGNMLNEDGSCNECGPLSESKKKILRLTESELIKTIENIVREAKNDPYSKSVSKGQTIREPKTSGVPGVTVTKKAQSGSSKEGKEYSSEVGKKMKDYLSFEGNDNPEFPKQVGKGEKMVVKNTDEENEYVEDNRGGGMQNLKYDHEPTERFKERVKKSLEGDSTMGNSQESGNSVKTDTGKKMVKQIKRSEEKKEKEPMYVKDGAPIRDYKTKKSHVAVNESKVLSEEIEKIKNIYSYNKKTQ